jgi:hypothetical protein
LPAIAQVPDGPFRVYRAGAAGGEFEFLEAGAGGTAGRSGAGSVVGVGGCRQLDLHDQAAADAWLGPDCAAVGGGDRADDGQARADAAAVREDGPQAQPVLGGQFLVGANHGAR